LDTTISIPNEDDEPALANKVTLDTGRAILVPKGTAPQLTTTTPTGHAATDESDDVEDMNLVLSVSLRLVSSPPEATLPHVNIRQDYQQEPLLPELTIAPIRWHRSGKEIGGKGCHRMGLPSTLNSAILQYLTDIGMTKAVQHYLYTEPFERTKRSNKMLKFQSWDWFMERPRDYESHDLLTFIPASKDAHVDALAALSGFDVVLNAIGQHFDWDGIVISHVSVFATSQGDPDRLELDYLFENTDNKAYNLMIPLVLDNGNDEQPELDIHDPDDILIGKYKHNENEGLLLGDYCRHSMRGMTNLRDGYHYYLYMSISMADVNATNAESVTPNYYLDGYPFNNWELTLEAAGTHWNKNDPAVKLPKRKAA
jgi:hypothetical protein